MFLSASLNRINEHQYFDIIYYDTVKPQFRVGLKPTVNWGFGFGVQIWPKRVGKAFNPMREYSLQFYSVT